MGFRSYSPSTKIAAVRMIRQGYTPASVCRALGESISRQSFDRWMDLYRETRRVIRDPDTYQQRGPTFLLSAQDADFMIGLIQAEPDLFLDELRERLYDNTETLLSIATLHRNLVMRLLITLKKANTVNIKKSLTAKYAFIEEMASIPAEYLSHICSWDLLRVRARSKKGKQANRYLRDQNPERFTLLPGISFFGLLAVTVTNQTVKRPQFQHFLKYSLLPRMNRYPGINSCLVMDNARIHRGGQVAELCEAAGVRLVYLPPYTPELNPIELCFSQVKARLRRTQALVNAADPEWAIESTTYRVITESLCQRLYAHTPYKCPPFPREPAVPGAHFPLVSHSRLLQP
ncbi:hypothetical protein PSTG_15235 [Puccinia striiformis f. sp. tritici PST-78]|uniref:Tc1-like transposase DDE domain-containing protein n=1 Tax=Puccinia striiformis f. sp. tritici PST-78 TaxID=1165861 RepID=A0A0L0UWG8_9BASI|nr:hypothetical protein PSTG_15235 [Puccinia striiformis f. sp. tritici PST-78]